MSRCYLVYAVRYKNLQDVDRGQPDYVDLKWVCKTESIAKKAIKVHVERCINEKIYEFIDARSVKWESKYKPNQGIFKHKWANKDLYTTFKIVNEGFIETKDEITTNRLKRSGRGVGSRRLIVSLHMGKIYVN